MKALLNKLTAGFIASPLMITVGILASASWYVILVGVLILLLVSWIAWEVVG